MKYEGDIMKVRHTKYGQGRLISFDPLTYMVIDFSKNGKSNPVMISTTREHLKEVILKGGFKLSQVVDLKNPKWYPRWRLQSNSLLHN